MKKIYDKSETTFAIMWIIIYVVGASICNSISESIGMPRLVSLVYSVICVIVLLGFIKKNGLSEIYGLCSFKGDKKTFLYFIPIALISITNLTGGLALNDDLLKCVIMSAAVAVAGIVEELIFRGLLFVGMCKDNVKSAIIVSSVTFGIGHIVNLLNGAPLFSTLCQIIYAVAIGFCFTIVFKTGKSLIPCIISHFVVNALSVFAVLPEGESAVRARGIFVTVYITVISVVYSLWLVNKHKDTILDKDF
ncbi:MAG: CPBP family intramembrane metalloprotease [Oscillospiraceae bacterium]|nr:CPBP family intramembrane metalloprotease [Oscillospiraceae bacterium]